MLMFRRKSDYNFKELFLASFFNISAKRSQNIKESHKGFNFQMLEKEMKKNFLIKSKIYCPFNLFPWFLNSTVFYVLKKINQK